MGIPSFYPRRTLSSPPSSRSPAAARDDRPEAGLHGGARGLSAACADRGARQQAAPGADRGAEAGVARGSPDGAAPRPAPRRVPRAALSAVDLPAAASGVVPACWEAHCRHAASSPWNPSNDLPGPGSTVTLGPGGTVAQPLSETTHSEAITAVRMGLYSAVSQTKTCRSTLIRMRDSTPSSM
jgi:hypothetical protein